MFRTGIVQAQDLANARVRVRFPDRDQMVSYWLPICFRKTQNDKEYWIPDLGEQVVCLMDEHDENGTVLGSIYSSVDQPPTDPNTGHPVQSGDIEQHTFKDGMTVQYNRATHAVTIALPAGATISIAVSGGGSISYDGSGNWKIEPGAGKVLIADSAGGVQPIARVGDQIQVPNAQGGSTTLTGTIVSGSSKASAGG
jgi:phage baseplate assembly protein V